MKRFSNVLSNSLILIIAVFVLCMCCGCLLKSQRNAPLAPQAPNNNQQPVLFVPVVRQNVLRNRQDGDREGARNGDREKGKKFVKDGSVIRFGVNQKKMGRGESHLEESFSIHNPPELLNQSWSLSSTSEVL